MRLNITDNKNQVVTFLFDYLTEKVHLKEVKIILNGKERFGLISEVTIDLENFNWIQLSLGDDIFEIPFNQDSKIRFDRDLFFFETESHTTLIYI